MFVDLSGALCLVVGGGTVGSRRALALLQFGARVTLVAPIVPPEWLHSAPGNLTVYARRYQESDLDGIQLCVAATSDITLNASIAQACNHRHIPVNVASDMRLGTFHFPALVLREDICIGLHAGGKPYQAKRLRAKLNSWLNSNSEEIL